MRSSSNGTTRRKHEVRKGEIFERMEAQSSSAKKKRHLQKWVKKIGQLE
jgi:hypothetical protein